MAFERDYMNEDLYDNFVYTDDDEDEKEDPYDSYVCTEVRALNEWLRLHR